MKILIPIFTLALVGCSTSMRIGDVPTEPAPQIVFLGAKDIDGADYLTWRDIPSFGQTPAELQALGDYSCMNYELVLRAIGYHPNARDRAGEPIRGGGFFCAVRSTGGYADKPPALVSVDGQVGWDRPTAFGSVPSDRFALGERRCSEFGTSPLAYHPNARGLDGQPIEGGGFLCRLPEQTK